jgi:hypothetical protein
MQQYGGLELSLAQRLKQLEDENRQLKQRVADLSLDHLQLSQRRAAGVVGADRLLVRRGAPTSKHPTLREQLWQLAFAHPRKLPAPGDPAEALRVRV